MGVSPYQLAQASGILPQPQQVLDPEYGDIVVSSNRTPPVGAAGRTPPVAQPAWRELSGSDRPADPLPVDPNAPQLLDRRRMLFEAQEAQRAASAQAAGVEYKERRQKGGQFKTNPGLQFGTTGVARDVIGNLTDLLGTFVGRRPTYRNEKFRDAIYGWDQPGGLDAAISRGMQYDPEMTMDFLKGVSGVRAQQANTEAMSESRKTMTGQRLQQDIAGLAYGITGAPSPTAAYNQMRQPLQQMLNQRWGEAAPQLPEEPDQETMNSLLSMAGGSYKGSDIQRERKAVMDDKTKTQIAGDNNAIKLQIAKLNAASREKVAQMAASGAYSRAQLQAQVRRELEENGLVETARDIDLVTGSQSRTYNTRGNVRGGLRTPGGRSITISRD